MIDFVVVWLTRLIFYIVHLYYRVLLRWASSVASHWESGVGTLWGPIHNSIMHDVCARRVCYIPEPINITRPMETYYLLPTSTQGGLKLKATTEIAVHPIHKRQLFPPLDKKKKKKKREIPSKNSTRRSNILNNRVGISHGMSNWIARGQR